jgi:hypothetical protein
MKMRCAVLPHRAPTISSQVCAYGALSFNFAASYIGVSLYTMHENEILMHHGKE